MQKGVVRWAIFASWLALSACTAVPLNDSSAPPDAPSSPAVRRAPVTPAAPAVAPLADSAPPPAVTEPDANLLAGEVPREFEQGKASWYGPRFHGRRTASGERYDVHGLTAAHRTLPFGTLVRVRSLVNGKEVDVRITDRGPFSRKRVIDLSQAAAEAIDMVGLGVKDVLLLVPDSTPAVVEAPPARPAPPKRRSAAVRRVPNKR